MEILGIQNPGKQNLILDPFSQVANLKRFSPMLLETKIR